MGRNDATRQRLREAALTLFTEHGYEASSTAAIAAYAGVSEMTLFRHFASKEDLLVDDPYDPVIATAVRSRPAGESPMQALVAGIRGAWGSLSPRELVELRQRLRIVAETPSLRGALSRSGAETVSALCNALAERGAEPLVARVAAEAVVAGLSEALLYWAGSGDSELRTLLNRALSVLGGGW